MAPNLNETTPATASNANDATNAADATNGHAGQPGNDTLCQVMSLNIRKGLLSKKKQILNFMYSKEVGIAFLSEVETKQLTLENLVCDGYKTVTPKTESKHDKARIVALVANSVPFNVRPDLMSPKVPTIWLEITRYNMKNILVCGIYRQWKGDQLHQLNIVCDQIRRASAEDLPLLVCGDINLDSTRWSSPKFKHKSMSDKWKSTIASAGLMMEDMGLTWESDYRLKNGKYKKSTLDHFYHSAAEVNIDEQDGSQRKKFQLCLWSISSPKYSSSCQNSVVITVLSLF